MNTKFLLGASAALMAAGGLALQFAPHEVLAYAGYPASGLAPVVVQLLGALYLGFALLNWMSKGVRMGGIYARPLAVGNVLHFLAGAFTLLHYALRNPAAAGVWVGAAGYALLAVLFGAILFVSPRLESAPERG
ncbi:hypothetical protein Q3A66_20730 [Hymenobacter sp. BT770]|uniref:hypothetical protein n=1 Tax=Hymenobacter sp. BT770 TaxID=2886942 RepID=UPI001D13071A|nr:hypothetical protein [Hymenobacter sp. BT770]MCC3155493.1 hypothetical protein [Hymenobacter sp. BT770]MDO3417500.1 hypothetical protein [Hymenobacter sp. BT770]